MKNRFSEFIAIWQHKLAFLKVRNANNFLKSEISFTRAVFHDLGKSINVLILGDSIATSIHRKLAGHHQEKQMNWKQKVEAFCDWECARYTKPSKPLDGVETWEKYYSHVQLREIISLFQTHSKKF